MAHLVNFLGTDTLHGIHYANQYYGDAAGHSVMATEHSTTTIYSREGECDAYAHFLEACPEDQIISIVADSYDIWTALREMFGGTLKEKILARSGKTVIRPDSGDPVEVSIKVLKILEESFGTTINNAGYKQLPENIGVIYGDGINLNSLEKILKAVIQAGYAASNIVFGMGGGLLQQLDRDTHKFAFKCSAALRGETWVDVFKDPITDQGKKSKRGRMKLIQTEDGYRTVNQNEPGEDHLHIVYENGILIKEWTFEEVRQQHLTPALINGE